MMFVLKRTAEDGPDLEVFKDDEVSKVMESIRLTGSYVVSPDTFMAGPSDSVSYALVIRGMYMSLKLE